MQRRLVVVPEWVGQDALLLYDQQLPALTRMASMGRVSQIAMPEGQVPTPEAAYLGLDPDITRVASGPLVVAALGAEPPARSVHFHLSLVSLVEEAVQPVSLKVPEAELIQLETAVRKLDTKRLTVVWGDDVDHGLVWEDGSIELGTTCPQPTLKPFRAFLPEGDGESMLRRFIDDSVNLLSELDFNLRRVDDGLAPLNCLWPWGHGFQPSLPDLGLRRGKAAWVESASIRLHGLSRLSRYRHGSRRAFGVGTAVRLESLVGGDADILVFDQISEFRAKGQLEEAKWLTRELDRRLFEPWISAPKEEDLEILVLATGSPVGLAVHYRSGIDRQSATPFDERATEDTLTVEPLWKLADRFLSTASL